MILIDHGARVTPTADMLANGQDQNAFYLLHYAVDDGLIDIAKVLIEKGRISLNTLDKSGWSALHLAAGHNNLEMLSLLLDKGADVNIRVCQQTLDFLGKDFHVLKDSNGNTPLAWAREMNASEVMNELTKRCAVADKEWHGEKLQMKTDEERAEDWAAGEHDQDGENQPGQEINPDEAGRFEIEFEDSKPKRQTSLDGLQRQRQTTPNTVY